MCPGEVCARIERQDSEAGQPGALAFAAKNLRLNDYPRTGGLGVPLVPASVGHADA